MSKKINRICFFCCSFPRLALVLGPLASLFREETNEEQKLQSGFWFFTFPSLFGQFSLEGRVFVSEWRFLWFDGRIPAVSPSAPPGNVHLNQNLGLSWWSSWKLKPPPADLFSLKWSSFIQQPAKTDFWRGNFKDSAKHFAPLTWVTTLIGVAELVSQFVC